MDGNLLKDRKNSLVDCRKFIQKEIAHIIVPLFVMTGCNQNCGIYGKRKKIPRKKIYRCDKSLPRQPDVMRDFTLFVIKLVYNSDKIYCANIRKTLKENEEKCTTRLVPDKDILEHLHTARNIFV